MSGQTACAPKNSKVALSRQDLGFISGSVKTGSSPYHLDRPISARNAKERPRHGVFGGTARDEGDCEDEVSRLPSPGQTELRLAELIGALSLATDLANGFPHEKALRTTVLATGLGARMDLAGSNLADTYYLPLLRFIGCTSFAFEEAMAFGGDDIAFRNAFAPIDHGSPPELLKTAVGKLGKGSGLARRTRAVGGFLAGGRARVQAMSVANCEVGVRLSARLGMSEGVQRGLDQIHERWDGKGIPAGLSGDRLTLPVRILHLAHVVEIHHRLAGREAALTMVRKRRGGQFDPEVATAFLAAGADLLRAIEEESIWEVALEAEPLPRPWLPRSRLTEVASAFADFVDLKSPYTLGHSSGVARLAESAAHILGMSDADVESLKHAGLLHDLGRVSVPNGIWDKRGPLSVIEWERVRLHPYYSERVLSRSALLSPIAGLAGMHHERLDGTGYYRESPAALLPTPARVLAAADAYHAMTEERPHRPPLPPAGAGRELEAESAAGRLDREAVAAVLEAAGQRSRRSRAPWPAGLSEREVQVLRLVAQGRSNKAIGKLLFISDRTVQAHVAHIYIKIGVSSRAGAALFAMENDLIHL